MALLHHADVPGVAVGETSAYALANLTTGAVQTTRSSLGLVGFASLGTSYLALTFSDGASRNSFSVVNLFDPTLDSGNLLGTRGGTLSGVPSAVGPFGPGAFVDVSSIDGSITFLPPVDPQKWADDAVYSAIIVSDFRLSQRVHPIDAGGNIQ